MTDIPESRGSQPVRARRLLLALSFVVAVSSLSVFTAWAATDACFDTVKWQARVTLRLQSIPSANPEMAEALGMMDAMRAIRWDPLGKRVIVFYALCCTGMIATASVCYFTARRMTAQRILACAVVCAGWVTLYCTQDAMHDWRTHRQVAKLLPKFEQVCNALHNQWPTQPGNIPPGIEFSVLPDKYPDVLALRRVRSSYPFHEDFGPMITRGKNGIIRFDLAGASDSCVEFHPNGTIPSAHTSGFDHPSPPVWSVTALKEKWYLVRYGG